MDDLLIRQFETADTAACLALFDGNVPDFFAQAERDDFRTFLRSLPGLPYLVATRRGRVLACGGYELHAGGTRAGLTWGMVDRGQQGMGIGRALTAARLARLAEIPGLQEVRIETSQHTRGFYEGFGFTLIDLVPNGFGPGLDRCDMVLRFPRP